jgi:hypothetical protein
MQLGDERSSGRRSEEKLRKRDVQIRSVHFRMMAS